MNPGDYGSLHHGWCSLGRYRWDVSRESLKKLENIVAELDSHISREASRDEKDRCQSRSCPQILPKSASLNL